MSDVQEAIKKLMGAVQGNEALENKLGEAVQARDPGAVAAIAADLGIELDAADIALGKRKLDEDELEAVAGGHEMTCDDWHDKTCCILGAGADFWL